jgi:hypothetical protein
MAPQLDLIALRRLLKTAKTRLPKDGLLTSNCWRLPENRHRNRDRRIERATLQALTGPGSSTAEQTQVLRQANCMPSEPCGEMMCWFCKHRAWLKLRRKLAEELDHAVNDNEISFATIVLGVCKPSRKAVHRLMVNFRSWLPFAADAWGVLFFGRFEVDLVLDQWVNTTSFKRRTLRPLGLDPDGVGPVAVVHIHFIAYHPGLGHWDLAYRLRRRIRGCRRTEVRPLDSDQSQTEALDNLTRYMLKSLPPKDALFGRGSRLCRPRKPDAMRLHNKLVKFLAGKNGECIVRPKDTPESEWYRC